MTGAVIRIGIDENGLGPRLGPLVVTAVVARVDGDGHKRVETRPRGAIRERLGDSKRLVAYGDSALGEAWARAIAAREGQDGSRESLSAATPDDLVRMLSLDEPAVLRAPCPGPHAEQCWSVTGDAFSAEPGLVAAVRGDLEKLERQGVSILYARSIITCARRLNDGIARGLTRFHVDLHSMERLALDARARSGGDVMAICGKVGGFNRYADAFGPLHGRLHAVAAEGRARSEYAIPGLGRIAFVRDAEEQHILVGMASLVGKWVRDLLMGRIVRYHRAGDPGLPDASGYHDPVTTRFIAATRLTRTREALPDDCFERRAWRDYVDQAAEDGAAPTLTSPPKANRRASAPSRPS